MIQLPPVYTVANAMSACGIIPEEHATRLADEVFHNNFSTTMDKSFKDLDKDIESFRTLTVAEGRIRITPGIKQKLRAFIQWARDLIRKGLDPTSEPFPVHLSAELISRYNSHALWQERSKTISDSAKPSSFTKDAKWEEWQPVFVNYLRTLPGRNGVPLSYIVRDNDDPDPISRSSFLDEYVAMSPLQGPAYIEDAGVVHTLLASLISGNDTATAIMKELESMRKT